MRKKDKSVIFRLEGHVHKAVQDSAAELGLSLSEYARLMTCWPFVYTMIGVEARHIVQSSDDPAMAVPLLRNAILHIDTRLEQVKTLVEEIQATAPRTQQQSLDQLLALRAQLEEHLGRFEAAAAAFRTVRKRLGEPPQGKKEGR